MAARPCHEGSNRANPGARTQNDPRSPDRTIRALMSLVDDLTVEREEGGPLALHPRARRGGPGAERGATLPWRAPRSRSTAGGAPGHGPISPWSTRSPSGHRPRASLGARAPRRRLAGRGPPEDAPAAALGVLCSSTPERTALPPTWTCWRPWASRSAPASTTCASTRSCAPPRSASEVLNRITSTLTSGLELKTVVPAFARELRALQSFDRLACGFVNDTGDYIEIVALPEDAAWGLGSVMPVVGSGPGFVVLNNRAVLQSDLVHSHRFIEDMRLLDEGLRSYVILPLNCRGRGIGVLGLASQQREPTTTATLARLQPLADSVALAFENVRLFQKTRELSDHRRGDAPLQLPLLPPDPRPRAEARRPLQVDPVPDLPGPRSLQAHQRPVRPPAGEPHPARGGLPDPRRGARDRLSGPLRRRRVRRGLAADRPRPAPALAEKLRSLLEDHVFLQEEGINARLGASLGIATYPTEAQTKESLIRLADKRMYEDKIERKAGR